jgi:hypothetical protein
MGLDPLYQNQELLILAKENNGWPIQMWLCETDHKKAIRGCLVILGAIFCAQATLHVSYQDYKRLLAIQDKMHPINFVTNIAKDLNPQVICLYACVALLWGDLRYPSQLSQKDKYLCPEGEISTSGWGPCLDWDGVWWPTQSQEQTSDSNTPIPLSDLVCLKPMSD